MSWRAGRDLDAFAGFHGEKVFTAEETTVTVCEVKVYVKLKTLKSGFARIQTGNEKTENIASPAKTQLTRRDLYLLRSETMSGTDGDSLAVLHAFAFLTKTGAFEP
ncbi:hypothetical protein HUJ05_002539 [Dendroctonus ponderosae]|nr:hypothetical protein HUJ05_002539 [Dendroctonus ponderosae]